jgi:fucose 4-O-acetylase-like acetyltransferase
MKERINWIDWAKALAVCSVVFCHLPQSQEWFYYRYLQALTMVVFFFISGYLKKDRGSDKENWRKYLQSLVTPYIIYNVIVYPYWILKFYLMNGAMPDFFQAMKPLLGALFLEHENAFCEPLNGPLWYLPAILIMHIIIDLCRKTKHQHWIMITLCVISFILYAANKYWYFAPNLTPMGLMRNLPYYYIGYLFGHYHLFKDCSLKHDLISCVLCLSASILLFAWHLDAFFSGHHMLHIILFYHTNVLFLFGVLYGCKVLNGIRLSVVTNISIGTLVIVGLHIVAVTIVNYALSHFSLFSFHLSLQSGYHWYDALPTALFIIALLYPIILWAKKHAPIFIGRRLIPQTN